MKKDNITDLFDSLKGTFDIEEPNNGHQQRFLEKLNADNTVKIVPIRKNNTFLFSAIAASFVILLSLGIMFFKSSPSINEQVVEISPEISKTEFYFTNIIEKEIVKLESEKSPETKKIVDDTMLQLVKLDTNYKNLEKDLINGGNSKLILSAMITNFQTRIDLLQDVLLQVEEIKKLKNTGNENTII